MIAKLERGARPTSVGEISVLSTALAVPAATLLSTDEMIPSDVTVLLEMRRSAVQVANALEDLIEQSRHISEGIDIKRALLVSSVSLYDKTLAIVSENRGVDWLASQGMDNTPLAGQDPRFVALGAYGENPGPEDEYVLAHLKTSPRPVSKTK
ncbi:hypothetical protein ABH924_000138 [Arthrobacter sp. GAS37]